MARYPRPENDFWIIDHPSHWDNVQRHIKAGFPKVPEETVRLRLFLLLDFLWTHGMLTERLAASAEEVGPETQLFNRHLTDEGYYFLQTHLPKWSNGAWKFKDEAKERALLESGTLRPGRMVSEVPDHEPHD